MSKKQTRRSISFTREIYAELLAFAAKHEIPASQVAAQALRGIMRGDLTLEPAVDPSALSRGTAEQRGHDTCEACRATRAVLDVPCVRHARRQ